MLINNLAKEQAKEEDVKLVEFKKAIYNALPDIFKKMFNQIEFKEFKPPKLSKNDIPYMPVAKIPLEFVYNNVVFRIIPRYPPYAVSNFGMVINYFTKQILRTTKTKEYVLVNILDPYSRKMKLTTVHRLVALAWVPNDDWKNKNVVDHIDGNKTNNIASNLRWVSYSNNITHSVNKFEKRWVTLRLSDNTKKSFPSLAEVEKFLDIKRNHLQSSKCPILITDKNNEDWILDDLENFSNFGATKEITGLKGKNIYHLYINGELEKTYETIDEIIKDHGRKGRISFEDLKEFIKDYYSKRGLNAELVDVKNKKKVECYQAKNLETGEVFTADNTAELGRLIGVDRRIVYQRFNIRKGLPYKGWVFKKCTEAFFPEPRVAKNNNKILIAEKDNKVIEFKSLREASRFFNVDRKTIKKRLENNQPLNGYKLTIKE